uniref:Ubiquitin-like domain-containing protein n=1 Tax=Clytia hemisphaerica TaxID=252671 RepID=A0A7M5VFV6_9CNID
MKNNIKVDFGDDVTSIFLWHKTDTLRKLKECINKRFNVPINDQIIKHENIIVDEELFSAIFRNRFNRNVVFKVEIPDPVIIKGRRAWISKQNRVGEIVVPDPDKIAIQFQIGDPERLVLDLKRDIKSALPVERRLFLLNNCFILDDGYVIADLFLDFEDVLLTMLDSKENIQLILSKWAIPLVDILIPRIDCEDLLIEYPLHEIGDMRISVLKDWIEARFHIPVEEQELHCEDHNLRCPAASLEYKW